MPTKTIWQELDEIAALPPWTDPETVETLLLDIEGSHRWVIIKARHFLMAPAAGRNFAEAARVMRGHLNEYVSMLVGIGLMEKHETWKRLEALAEKVLAATDKQAALSPQTCLTTQQSGTLSVRVAPRMPTLDDSTDK